MQRLGYRLRDDAAAMFIVILVVRILLLKVILCETHPYGTKNSIDVIDIVSTFVVLAVV